MNYYSAGTVEFLLDSEKNYYFMEMNTRIQVEHPVTELVTGLDLIEWQIKIANGDKLTLKQKDIKLTGWAIECRINAEDVQSGFAPDPGKIEKIIMPTDKYVRVDTGVRENSVIVPGYDSMIAKLIVSGTDRKDAMKNLKQALDKVWIKGCKTTLPFFRMLVRNQKFLSGDFTTSFIEKDVDQYHYNSEYEEQIASWLAVKLFIEENYGEDTDDSGKVKGGNNDMSPWLLNKRLKQF